MLHDFKKNKHLRLFKNKARNHSSENHKSAKIKPLVIKLPIKQLNPRAFSLLEMSLVLIIVSVILSSGLSIATSNLENARNNVTKERIREVYKNLGIFLATKNRLPCPSSLRLKESDDNYGSESPNTSGNCTDGTNNLGNSFVSSINGDIIVGGIPNKDLNLGSDFAKDGFGNRLFYAIDRNFVSVAGAKNIADTTFLNIYEKVGTDNKLIADNIRLVIFSTGANGNGAVVASNAIKTTKSTNADEEENDVPPPVINLINFDNDLVSRSEGNDNFDDILFYRTRNQIFQDANLPDFLEGQIVTKERIREVYKNLGVFLATQRRLPCPSSLRLKESDDNYGSESPNTSGNCTDGTDNLGNSFVSSSNGDIIVGGIPNKDLNLGSDFAKDGFGNRLFYVIDRNFVSDAEAKNIADTTFLNIYEKVGTNNKLIANNIRLVIFSTGANGNGAIAPSTAIKTTKSTNADEEENDVPPTLINMINQINFDNKLVSSSGGNKNFDDIMFYRTRNQILQDANVLDLLECPQKSDILYGLNFTWPAAKYNEKVPSNQDCPQGYSQGVLKPTKRCGLFGLWQENVIDPCLN
jgi:prepilin-type N-terminal cleavage/methylation domain-containing protein